MSRTLEYSLATIIRRTRDTGPMPRAVRQATERGASLGVGSLSLGAAIVSITYAVAAFAFYLTQLPWHPAPELSALAWLVHAATLTGTLITLRRIGREMPSWLFAVLIVGLALTVAIDFAAVWTVPGIIGNAAAAASAAFSTLLLSSLRPAPQVFALVALVGAVFVAAISITTRTPAETLPVQVAVLASVLAPGLVGPWIAQRFRSMVQLELDRVLVHSTVSAPPFAVGLLASEQLARLDLAAEKLLDSVATGRAPLPLDPKTATTAASLATELRLHLLEGRRETWLQHAVSESELLRRSVLLTDSGGLAGLLEPRQRDGLLSAIWLLVGEVNARSVVRRITLTLGPATQTRLTPVGHRLIVPIRLEITGIGRTQVDPAAWNAIGAVGRYTHSLIRKGIVIDIECLADNPGQ
ncbi:hypothetical protein [Ruicaihuangia caeni]|uniref:hypothetical protein n=1 Tax=Ruicaihuangia caeni TaxID=3042517 RepID=UPI00338F082B